MSFQMIYGILFIFLVVALGLWFLGDARSINITLVQYLPGAMTPNYNESHSGKTPYLEKAARVGVIDLKV